jgi:hypothetical protein
MEDNLVYAAFSALLLIGLVGVYLFFVKYRQHKAKSPPWRKLVLGNLLVFLLLGSGGLLLGETYFRFWYDKTDTFSLTKVSERWFQRHYRINNTGSRDNCTYHRAPPPDTRRITFVGDSFAAGHGVADVEDRFANLLRRKHALWEVHALTQNGANSGDELKTLERCIELGYVFDCVVLVYNLNDIDDLTPEWMERYRQFLARYHREPPGFLIQHSYLLNTLYLPWWAASCPELSNYVAIEHQAYLTAPWQKQMLRLKAIRDFVRQRGAELCVVTFPHLNLLGPDYSFRDVHRQLDEFWRSLGVAHLDLLPVYEPYGPRRLCISGNDAHPNPFAHGLAADALAPFLQASLDATRRNKRPAAATPK